MPPSLSIAAAEGSSLIVPGGLNSNANSENLLSENELIRRSAQGDYECVYCGKQFVAPAFLKRHIRAHTGEKPFKCPHCDFRATQKGNLNSHVINKHNDFI